MKIGALLIITVLTITKATLLFLTKSTGNIFFLVLAGTLIFWMTYAMLYNRDLSGPFGYKQGRNQVIRWINYFVFMGIFLILLFKL